MGAIENLQRICHDDLIQGSPEWLEFRARHHGASEAAAMLGLSKKVKRNELLRIKKTGTPKEFSDWVQKNVLDYGHEVEAEARPYIEEIIGAVLYPVTYSMGKLSASCDGLTMMGDIAFEHKQYNAELFALVSEGTVPDEHMPQCQQILDVTGAEKLIFACSDGTDERMAYTWVYPDPEWVNRITAGWAQFDRDLETFVVEDIKPEVVAAPVEALPSPFVNVDGQLAVRDNLTDFGAALRAYIDRLPSKPATDQEFADADAAVKRLGEVEDLLKTAKAGALSQVQSIATMTQSADTLIELARTTRLALEKLVKAEKENRRNAIVTSARRAYLSHMDGLDAQIGRPYMPAIKVDFEGAIKGLKTMTSIQNAADTALANAKIEADKWATLIKANMKAIADAGMPHLFPDESQIVLKAADYVDMLIKQRVAEHKAAQEKRDAEIAAKAIADEKARREREEAEKADERNRMAMSEIEGIRQQVVIAQAGRLGVRKGGTIECLRDTLSETEAWPITEEQFGSLISIAQSAKDSAVQSIRQLLEDFEKKAAAPAPVADQVVTNPATVQIASVTPDVSHGVAQSITRSAPTLALGVICERLGFTVNAAFLEALGFPAKVDRNARLYHEQDFPRICAALIKHLNDLRAATLQQAA